MEDNGVWVWLTIVIVLFKIDFFNFVVLRQATLILRQAIEKGKKEKEKAKKAEKVEKVTTRIITSKAAAMLAKAIAASDTAQAAVNRLTSAPPTDSFSCFSSSVYSSSSSFSFLDNNPVTPQHQ